MPPLTQDRDFERTFADLAYGTIQDKAPGLADHVLGFQVVDANEDQTHAVGIFGCRLGAEIIYVPMFFMNGEMKGTEMMYLKNQDMFVPLDESWVTYIQSRKPYVLGDESDFGHADTSKGQIDLYDFSETPEFGKASSVLEAGKSTPQMIIRKQANNKKIMYPAWRSETLQKWALHGLIELGKHRKSDLYKKAADNLDLKNFLKQAKARFSSKFIAAMQKNAAFGSAVLKFYAVDDLREVLNHSPITKKAAELDGNRVRDVTIIDYKAVDNFSIPGLSDSEKAKLMSGDIVIKDNRTDASKTYKFDASKSLVSPTRTGIYNLVTKSGDTIRAFVLVGAKDICGGKIAPGHGYTQSEKNRCCVIDLDSKSSCCAHTSEMCGELEEDSPLLFSSQVPMKKASEISANNTYVAVTPSGDGVIPFYVVEKKNSEGDEEGQTTLIATTDFYSAKEHDNRNILYTCTIIISDSASGVKTVGDTLFLPKGTKFIQVKNEYDKGYKEIPLCPPGMAEEYLWRSDKLFPLKVYSTGTDYQITVGKADQAIKTAGYISGRNLITQLCVNYGLRGDDAKELLKQADAKGAAKAWISFAEGYPDFTKKAAPPFLSALGSIAPSMNMDAGAGVDSTLGVPTQSPFGESQLVDALATGDNEDMYDPDTRLDDQQLQQAVLEASQTGQKEVFDTALIGSLVNTVDSTSLIDKYIGDLVLGLDRVGRIYFLLLQHYDDFTERYGQADLADLEDSLKNTFSSIGELVLFLKQKTVEMSPGSDRTDVTIGGGMNE